MYGANFVKKFGSPASSLLKGIGEEIIRYIIMEKQ